MTNDEFDSNYTTRAGGYFSRNAQLTQHVISRKTKRTLCGRETDTNNYRSGWTNQFDHMSFQFDGHEYGECQRCAKSSRKLGFTDTMFRPLRDPATTASLTIRTV